MAENLDVAKTQVFLKFIQEMGPKAGLAADYTAELTQKIKDQIKETGHAPVVDLFNQVIYSIFLFVLEYQT